jgi:plasmid stability protein
MTITIEIKPEIQAELARLAAAHGRPIESYAATLLEEAVHRPTTTLPEVEATDMIELFAPLRGLNIDFERDRDPGRDIQL